MRLKLLSKTNGKFNWSSQCFINIYLVFVWGKGSNIIWENLGDVYVEWKEMRRKFDESKGEKLKNCSRVFALIEFLNLTHGKPCVLS